MRAATLESRLEELGVLRSFSRPRVSNDNPYSESLFRTAKYRPDYPSRPFTSKEAACQWVASFADWYNHQHRHSGIKFVTPHQRHNGDAVDQSTTRRDRTQASYVCHGCLNSSSGVIFPGSHRNWVALQEGHGVAEG